MEPAGEDGDPVRFRTDASCIPIAEPSSARSNASWLLRSQLSPFTQRIAFTARTQTAETQTSDDLNFTERSLQIYDNTGAEEAKKRSVKDVDSCNATPSTTASRAAQEAPSRSEFDQMKRLIEFMKQQAVERDREL